MAITNNEIIGYDNLKHPIYLKDGKKVIWNPFKNSFEEYNGTIINDIGFDQKKDYSLNDLSTYLKNNNGWLKTLLMDIDSRLKTVGTKAIDIAIPILQSMNILDKNGNLTGDPESIGTKKQSETVDAITEAAKYYETDKTDKTETNPELKEPIKKSYKPEEIPELSFKDIYRLPENLQKAYLEMKAGENKEYNIKGTRGKDATANAIGAIIEGLASGGLKSLNKKITGDIGEMNFKNTILPSYSEVTGKQYTGMDEEEQKKLKTQYEVLKKINEQRPLTEQEKTQMNYLQERAKQNIGNEFNATGKSLEQENTLSANEEAFKQALDQKIKESNDPRVIELRKTLSKEDYDNWLQKASLQHKWDLEQLDKTQDVYSILSQFSTIK